MDFFRNFYFIISYLLVYLFVCVFVLYFFFGENVLIEMLMIFVTVKKTGVYFETIFTWKLLVNFINNYKEKASNTFN